jgi:hypothetical protein
MSPQRRRAKSRRRRTRWVGVIASSELTKTAQSRDQLRGWSCFGPNAWGDHEGHDPSMGNFGQPSTIEENLVRRAPIIVSWYSGVADAKHRGFRPEQSRLPGPPEHPHQYLSCRRYKRVAPYRAARDSVFRLRGLGPMPGRAHRAAGSEL